MNKNRAVKSFRLIAFASLLSFLLVFSSACVISTEDEAESIENILRELDAVEGEMTFVTKDGDIITITITKETPSESQNDDTGEEDTGGAEDVQADGCEGDGEDMVDLASILPYMESVEDVFELLGVWEDAHAWREAGLTWSHIAEELGYNADTMYAQLEEIIEERLKEAKAAGLINHEQLESKYALFCGIAMDWVQEIFADVGE